MSKVLAGLYYDSLGWYRLSCRFDRDMQERLKAELGRGNYTWSPDTKLWYVREACVDQAREVLESYGYQVKLDPNSPSKRLTKSPWEEILRSLPKDQAENLYRVAAGALHPDKGGDPERAKDLNEVWQRITNA